MSESPPISGTVDPRLTAVREVFAENFAERDEVGDAVSVSVHGRVVVDLWSGYADGDQRRQWQPDTLVNGFSVGKGFIALLVAQVVADGPLDLDAAVATIWSDFAQAGKASITVRQLLTHQAGLPAVRHRLPPGAMFDWVAMTDALAAEEPWWQPASAHGYHVNTYGFLVGEVLRRVTGRSPGDLLRGRIAGPLGADIHLGLPATDDHRVADFLWPEDPPPEAEPERDDGQPIEPIELMRYNAYFNPSGLSGAGVVNSRAWRAAEIPSTNTHASARGVARVYTPRWPPAAPSTASPSSIRLPWLRRPPSRSTDPTWCSIAPAGSASASNSPRSTALSGRTTAGSDTSARAARWASPIPIQAWPSATS